MILDFIRSSVQFQDILWAAVRQELWVMKEKLSIYLLSIEQQTHHHDRVDSVNISININTLLEKNQEIENEIGLFLVSVVK